MPGFISSTVWIKDPGPLVLYLEPWGKLPPQDNPHKCGGAMELPDNGLRLSHLDINFRVLGFRVLGFRVEGLGFGACYSIVIVGAIRE